MTYYAIKLNETEYYDGDPSRWDIPASDKTYRAAIFAQFVWAEGIAKSLQDRWPGAHVVPAPVVVDVQQEQEPEQEPKYRSPMRLQRDQLREELKRAWDAIPPGIASRSDSVSAAVAKLAKAYEASQEESAKCMETLRQMANENDQFQEKVAEISFERISLKAENAKLKAQIEARPEPVVDDIQLMLEGMRYQLDRAPTPSNPKGWRSIDLDYQMVERWHTTLQALATEYTNLKAELASKPEPVADAEIARVLEHMSAVIDKETAVTRGVTISYNDGVRWHDTLQAVGGDLVVARESLEQCREALPEELRGGSVLQGIASLIRSRTYAREQASQYARRYAEARDDRDALSSKLSKVQDAIAKALEL